MGNYIRVLQDNPDFARLWLAQVISLLGDWFNVIVLTALVATGSEHQGLAISGLLLARFLPSLFISPIAGVLLDRFDRKRLMILSDVLRAVIVLLLLFATTPDRLWLIYVLTVLQFCLSALFEPGRSAILPSVVRREDLVSANILSSITWSAMLAIGGVMGGLVATVFGTSAALVIDSVTFLISAYLISQIHPQTAGAAGGQGRDKGGASFQDFVDGLRYAVRNPSVGVALLVKLGGNFGSIDVLMTIYATSLFVVGDKGSGSLGVLWSGFGFGALAGPLLLNRLFNDGTVRTMRRLIIIGYACLTAGWFIIGGAPSLALTTAAVFVRAMGGSTCWTYSSVILQKTAPDAFLGRMFSLDQMGFQLGTTLSTIITGWLLEQLGAGQVRAIAYGSGFASLIPLVAWTLIILWVERRDKQVGEVLQTVMSNEG